VSRPAGPVAGEVAVVTTARLTPAEWRGKGISGPWLGGGSAGKRLRRCGRWR